MQLGDGIMSKLYTFEHVKVEKVVDGDTVVVFIDQGFDNYHRETIRFLELDTPETSKRAGASTKQVERGLQVKAWLQNRIEGKDIELKTRKLSGDDDKYGRYLGYIFIDGVCVNHEMFNLGFNKTEEEKKELKK